MFYVCMYSIVIICFIKTHGSESSGQYSRMYAAINNDAITTREYFTGMSVVQFQPSETLPSLTVSL